MKILHICRLRVARHTSMFLWATSNGQATRRPNALGDAGEYGRGGRPVGPHPMSNRIQGFS